MPPKITSGAKRRILGLREIRAGLSSDPDGVLTRGSKKCALCRFDMGHYFLRIEETK